MKLLIHDSPVGPLRLVSDGRALAALAFEHHSKPIKPLAEAEPGSDAVLDEARRQLDAYFAGRIQRFDLPLAPRGTAFQERVWMALREIPYGTTCSYSDLAAALGAPRAVRAVGGANGRNPISIIVPCHRVIGADGTLTGFGGGIDRKRFLLTHEKGAATHVQEEERGYEPMANERRVPASMRAEIS
jgi:methylated-DNA-[protein]-cysteine S-methyltransferase